MSSHKDAQTFDCDLEAAAQACRFALNEMQMLVKKDAGQSFVANEKVRLGFANPAKLEVNLSASGAKTTVAVNSSNFGLGPIQGGHVKGVAETFLSNVKFQLGKNQASAPSAGDDLAGQLEKLAEMKAKGLLSDEEFAAAKAKLL